MLTQNAFYRNASPDQNRNLKPTIAGHPTHNAYSASPSQLTLQSDMPQGQLPNSYHQYGYVQQHDPNQFQFGQPPYRAQPQLQTRHPQVAPPPHLTPQQQQQLPSPTTSRKRRISELSGDTMLPGPPGSIGAYANQSGLMGPPNDMEPSGHSNNQQQQPQQQQQHHQPQQQPQQPSQTQQQPPAPAPTGQAPSPAVKKGRTNTPWTPGEEHRLKQLRDQGSSWSEIAKNFPNRTEGSVKKHWYKDMHYADFGADEVSSFVRLTATPGKKASRADDDEQSTALLQAIKEYEANKWKVIGQKVGKPAKACEAFAKEQGWKV